MWAARGGGCGRRAHIGNGHAAEAFGAAREGRHGGTSFTGALGPVFRALGRGRRWRFRRRRPVGAVREGLPNRWKAEECAHPRCSKTITESAARSVGTVAGPPVALDTVWPRAGSHLIDGRAGPPRVAAFDWLHRVVAFAGALVALSSALRLEHALGVIIIDLLTLDRVRPLRRAAVRISCALRLDTDAGRKSVSAGDRAKQEGLWHHGAQLEHPDAAERAGGFSPWRACSDFCAQACWRWIGLSVRRLLGRRVHPLTL